MHQRAHLFLLYKGKIFPVTPALQQNFGIKVVKAHETSSRAAMRALKMEGGHLPQLVAAFQSLMASP
jgi:hypothetical protein